MFLVIVMHATAHIDPKTPPSVVRLWCSPYVVLRFCFGLRSAMRASVGAARTPFPNRSRSFALMTHCGETAEARTSFIAAVIALPRAITLTRDLMTSLRTPEMTRLRLLSRSDAPSMAPMRVLLYPSSVLRNTGSRENTMHVEDVHRNPQNASAQQLRLSVSLYTTRGSFCRTCPGILCASQLKMLACKPSFASRSSWPPRARSISSSSASSKRSCSALRGAGSNPSANSNDGG